MATEPKPEKASLNSIEFAKWNEKMAKEHDIEDFLKNSFFLIRYVEMKRIRLLLKFLQESTDDKVLEVGSGQGFILSQTHSKYRVGIDLAFNSLKKSQQLFTEKKLKLANANSECLPFKDHLFDRIICTEVIEHVQHPLKLMHEIIRLLKPNGKLILTVPNDTLVNQCKTIIEFLKLDRIFGIKYGGADDWHLHIFTMKKLKNLFKVMGLRIEKRGYSPSIIYPLRWVFRLTKI